MKTLACVCMVVFVLFAAAFGFSQEHPGKHIFMDTCKNCHGEDGNGDPMADKFYKVQIPRLTSDFVQSKSTDELKEIIINGRRKMQPVRPGTPTMNHRLIAGLKDEWMDDVIAYIRTLKQK